MSEGKHSPLAKLMKLRYALQFWIENPRPDEWILQEWAQDIDAIIATLEQATVHRVNTYEGLVEALEKWQWVEFIDSDHGSIWFCPDCRNEKRYGHHPKCSISAALKRAEERDESYKLA